MALNGKLHFWKKQGPSGNEIIGRRQGQIVSLDGYVESAFQEKPSTDLFTEAGYSAAEQAGCKLLFEIPAMLLEGSAERVAAVHCSSEDGDELYYLVLDSENGSVSVVRQENVPQTVIEFTRSYAGVLSMIANDQNLTRPLIQ